MTALTFTLLNNPEFTLDASPLIPDLLVSQSKEQLKNIKIPYGNQKIPVKNLFKVTGNDHANIHIKNSNEKVVSIGNGIRDGHIEVSGNAGDYLGINMRGGSIRVNGNTGDWAGCSMSMGVIEINGNTGSYLGAGLPGEPNGMTDGRIIVTGNAGDRVGDRMRRGTIIVCGNAGDYCGSRMTAGTIIVLDKAGKYVGFSMKRGTIVLAKKPRHIGATFRSCGNLKMQFLRLLFTQLTNIGNTLSIFTKYGPEAHRFAGDLASNGKGEILILQTIRKGS